MLGVNRSSHLSPVGDTNSLNQVLYLDPVPYFVFADGSWYTVMYGSIESAQFSRQRCLIFSTSGLVRSKNQPKLPPLMGQKHRPNRANPIMNRLLYLQPKLYGTWSPPIIRCPGRIGSIAIRERLAKLKVELKLEDLSASDSWGDDTARRFLTARIARPRLLDR
jgi:hypothetical protein